MGCSPPRPSARRAYGRLWATLRAPPAARPRGSRPRWPLGRRRNGPLGHLRRLRRPGASWPFAPTLRPLLAKSLLQGGEGLVPYAHARVGRIDVVRVVPRFQTHRLAGSTCGGAVEPEQGPQVEDVLPPELGGHARQRSGTGTTRQPQKDGLGLVVLGVAKEHGCGSQALSGLIECSVAGIASGVSGPPGPSTLTAMEPAGSSPRSAMVRTTASARSSEPSCRPWSIVTPPAERPALGPQRRAHRRALESRRPHCTRPAAACLAADRRSAAVLRDVLPPLPDQAPW